jgi:16S rRNA (cytosine1402-N4)-methyltransferase
MIAITSERHLPVLAQRCIDLLAPALQAPGSVMVDGTLGMGGHTELALTQLPNVTVIGIDRDPEALALATERLSPFGDRFIPVHANYAEIAEVVAAQGLTKVNGILLDLGVSSLQLDEPVRGFSYSRNAPLDMRMDQTVELTAAVVLNTYPEVELKNILSRYGEERFAPRIAKYIVERRLVKPWESTTELVELIQNAIPRKAQLTGGHPAKRTFQALRIEVNQELSGLTIAMDNALSVLAVQGRMVVESYQSLEDRIVKHAFAAGLTSSAPANLPFTMPEHEPYLKAITRGAEKADQTELELNPRAASVRLRAVMRTKDDSQGSKAK